MRLITNKLDQLIEDRMLPAHASSETGAFVSGGLWPRVRASARIAHWRQGRASRLRPRTFHHYFPLPIPYSANCALSAPSHFSRGAPSSHSSARPWQTPPAGPPSTALLFKPNPWHGDSGSRLRACLPCRGRGVGCSAADTGTRIAAAARQGQFPWDEESQEDLLRLQVCRPQRVS